VLSSARIVRRLEAILAIAAGAPRFDRGRRNGRRGEIRSRRAEVRRPTG
jgi:hypothetical protein